MTVQPPLTAAALVHRSFRQVLPRCAVELAGWRARAAAIEDPELRRQALASLAAKRFHADAGAVYATAVPPGPRQAGLIGLIVAFQTISDYLDNLCDRSTSLDPDDFRTLHRAMCDAVSPDAPLGDYYLHRPQTEDGYLAELVRACQRGVAGLPGYQAASPLITDLVGLYGDLQVHKHVRPQERAGRLAAWSGARGTQGAELHWWEYAAATGSTLAVFALFLAALDPALTAESARRIRDAYFPWICGLHILLDYLIDQDEDIAGGDLNFVAQYPSPQDAYGRIELFTERALAVTSALPDARFHRLVVQGLVGMYLSDDKVRERGTQRSFARRLTRRAGANALLFHWVSRVYRRRR